MVWAEAKELPRTMKAAARAAGWLRVVDMVVSVGSFGEADRLVTFQTLEDGG
jgi:hypothetical protein